MKAVRIHSFGGPDVLKYEDIPMLQRFEDIVHDIEVVLLLPVNWSGGPVPRTGIEKLPFDG